MNSGHFCKTVVTEVE